MEVPPALRRFEPSIGIVLGSGLGSFVEDRIEVAGELAFGSIPGFPRATAPGHAGRLVYGTAQGCRVLCAQGRLHAYEGHGLREVALPVRLMAAAGVRSVVLTNAAGGIRPDLEPGDLMLISDHINMLGANPLVGPPESGLARFPDMSAVYDPELRAGLREWAEFAQIVLKEGVYVATTGPCFETPAEIRHFRQIGADAVGMSTVPEAIVARAAGLRVLGISCITNVAAGLTEAVPSEAEVFATAARVRPVFAELLAGALRLAGGAGQSTV